MRASGGAGRSSLVQGVRAAAVRLVRSSSGLVRLATLVNPLLFPAWPGRARFAANCSQEYWVLLGALPARSAVSGTQVKTQDANESMSRRRFEPTSMQLARPSVRTGAADRLSQRRCVTL